MESTPFVSVHGDRAAVLLETGGTDHSYPYFVMCHRVEGDSGGSGWVGMRLDLERGGPDWDEVGEVITDAYRVIAPRSLVVRLGTAL